MKRWPGKGAMVVVLFSVPAVGCAAPGDRAAMEGAHAGDVNGAWRYVSGTFQGSEVPVVTGGPTTLVIETDRFSGVLVCNDYYGTLQGSPPGEWRIARIGATEVRCGPASVEADLHAYARALTTATSVSVIGEGSLRLHGNGADLHFRPDGDDSRAADQEQQRHPMKVSPATVQPGQQVALYFPERTMRGVGYVLERRVDDEWQLQFYLTSDGGSLGWTRTGAASKTLNVADGAISESAGRDLITLSSRTPPRPAPTASLRTALQRRPALC